MVKKKGVLAVALLLCSFFLFAVPANAAEGDLGGLTVAAALDGNGEIINAEFAVAARYASTDKIYVDVPVSLISDQAKAYAVSISGTTYVMEYSATWDDIAIAEFSVSDPNSSLPVPNAVSASKDEEVSLVYYYPDDGFKVGTAKIKITGYRNIGGGIVLYTFDQLENLKPDFMFPMSVINASGQVVGYVTNTGSATAVYTYVFDEAKFTGAPGSDGNSGSSQPEESSSQPAESSRPAESSQPSGSSQPATPGRDPVDDDGSSNSDDTQNTVMIVAAIAVVGLVLFFALKKKNGGSNGSGNAAPADAYYPTPTPTPVDIPPTVPTPVNIPPTVPTPTPVAPQRVGAPVVYGVGGEMDGRRYAIAQPTMTIGRERSCNICYSADTPGISHQHCVLAMQNGVLTLTDNGSTYGTYLRGTGKLTPQQPVALKDGDVFYLGEKKNAFRLTFE